MLSFHFNGSKAKALMDNGEESGEAGLIVSEILERLAAMRTWPFFHFVAFVTDRADQIRIRPSHRVRMQSRIA